ncbi:MAG: glycine cleavage system aminomethyltransferase GcvT [Pirellulaceae bacterium]
MTTELARTPLYERHVAHQARIVDFAGWSMPVQYTSIVEEHQATRRACGLFDVSHMGRLRFGGPDAEALLDRLLTRRVAGMKPGKIRYSLMTNPQGGILDDVLVYRLEDAANGEARYQLVVNASNRAKIFSWILDHLGSAETGGQAAVQMLDATVGSAMIAVQGPEALAISQSLLDVDLASMGYYTCRAADVLGQTGLVSRTGYTGEDGCELIVPAAVAGELWDRLLEAGRDRGAVPAGLGARDTLRLEAAMPLYGHELSEAIDPVQAGLGFAVNVKDHEFIGRDAIVARQQAADVPRRIGLELSGRRVPREHYAVLDGDRQVGEVTSGTFSPTLQRPIAMAYVEPASADVGRRLTLDIRGKRETAQVVELPFYKRAG